MAYINVTKENFEELVVKADKPVLLDFWATWCGPCKMIAPVVEALAEERDDFILGKVDVDAQMELAIRFGIASIPTLLLLDKGTVVNKAIGYMPKESIEKLLNL